MPDVMTDDEIYRVNQAWMGPPNVTMPFRARYVAWGVGITLFLAFFSLARIWVPFGFFTLAWSLVAAVAVTRVVCRKITHERGIGSVLVMFFRELSAPRPQQHPTGGAAATHRVRIRTTRPRPRTTLQNDGEQTETGELTDREAPRA